MSELITNEYISDLNSFLDSEWKRHLVLDIYNKWRRRALVEHTTQRMIRFSPKSGGKWFAILFPHKSGKLKLSISDYKEIICLSEINFSRATGGQFSKSEYGSREAFIDNPNQCKSVYDAFEMAYRLKMKGIS